ncbi:hypothetical protein DFH07DRAFT_769963 [Mycena maculata]|nr:hypothetical protein DFH07DRAFT_775174 [Mycena maculata]KAJ7766425.1 hypothetical protein DFH07DRAFT_769963 [Mycena maculata]
MTGFPEWDVMRGSAWDYRHGQMDVTPKQTSILTRKRSNDKKQVRNTLRANKQTDGVTAQDTIGEDDTLDGPGSSPSGRRKEMFLLLMTSLDTGTSINPTPTPALAEATAPIPSIFNPAGSTKRTPFSPRLQELAVAGVYLELTMFTNKSILDMFVNQHSRRYQPQKRTIIVKDGTLIEIYMINPSIFNDQNTLSHTRFNEAHNNYRCWYIENAPRVTPQLEAYDKHCQRCESVVLHEKEDFMMIKLWCKDWMQRATWNPVASDGESYDHNFATSRSQCVLAAVAGVEDTNDEDHDTVQYVDKDSDCEVTPPQNCAGVDRKKSTPTRFSPYAREDWE